MTRLILLALLLAHTIATALTLDTASVWSVFPPFRERFIYQMFSDIVASIGMVSLLCYLQLKRKNRSYNGLWAMMIGAIIVGSFSPLIYLLIEKDLFEIDLEGTSGAGQES